MQLLAHKQDQFLSYLRETMISLANEKIKLFKTNAKLKIQGRYASMLNLNATISQ